MCGLLSWHPLPPCRRRPYGSDWRQQWQTAAFVFGFFFGYGGGMGGCWLLHCPSGGWTAPFISIRVTQNHSWFMSPALSFPLLHDPLYLSFLSLVAEVLCCFVAHLRQSKQFTAQETWVMTSGEFGAGEATRAPVGHSYRDASCRGRRRLRQLAGRQMQAEEPIRSEWLRDRSNRLQVCSKRSWQERSLFRCVCIKCKKGHIYVW